MELYVWDVITLFWAKGYPSSAEDKWSGWTLPYNYCNPSSATSFRCSLWFSVGVEDDADEWHNTFWWVRTVWLGFWYPFFEKSRASSKATIGYGALSDSTTIILQFETVIRKAARGVVWRHHCNYRLDMPWGRGRRHFHLLIVLWKSKDYAYQTQYNGMVTAVSFFCHQTYASACSRRRHMSWMTAVCALSWLI